MTSSNGTRTTHAAQGSSAWLVLKFGGTSVASADRWRAIARILEERAAGGNRLMVVCSALAGTTDDLEALPELSPPEQDLRLARIRTRHETLIADLGLGPVPAVENELDALARLTAQTTVWDDRARARVLAQGELLSTRLGAAFLNRSGIRTRWVDARDLLHAVTSEGVEKSYLSTECDYAFSSGDRNRLESQSERVFVTQGFIARDAAGDTVLLGRGGSDTAAGYLASRLGADEVEIWTDVPGLFTANPRVIPQARLIRSLTYEEAETLAAMGAAALHPRSLAPARDAGIRMRIGWTDHPEAQGTFIHGPGGPREPGVKAISSRTGLSLISARREAKWQPVGFMSDVSACFSGLGLCMDLVASSPSDIRVTIDRGSSPEVADRLPALIEALSEVADVQVFPEVGSVSLVGREIRRELRRVAGTLHHLEGHDIHLISQAPNDLSLTYVTGLESTLPLIRGMHHDLFSGRDGGTFGDTWEELEAARLRDDDDELAVQAAGAS